MTNQSLRGYPARHRLQRCLTAKTSDRSFARRVDLTSLQLFVCHCASSGSIGQDRRARVHLQRLRQQTPVGPWEATLNTTLLYRHTRGVRPRPPVKACCTMPALVLFSLEKCRVNCRNYADGVRGHVRIHANISAIVQFLPEDLWPLHRRHSQIKD